MQLLLDAEILDDIHLGEDVGNSDHMVREEAEREDGRHQKGPHYYLLLPALGQQVIAAKGHGAQLRTDCPVEAHEDQEEDKEQPHHHQVDGPTCWPLPMEVEADFVAGFGASLTQEEEEGAASKNHPDDAGSVAAPLYSVDSEDLDGLYDLQVAVQANEAQEDDAGIHGDVERDSHHPAEEEGALLVVVVDSKRQAQDQKQIGYGQILHIHRDGQG